jgi:uncharacterized protein YceK
MKRGVVVLFLVLVIAAMAAGCSTTKSKTIATCWESNATGEILMQLNDDGSGTILARYTSDPPGELESFNVSWQKISDVVQVTVSRDKPEYQLPFEGNYLKYDEKQDLLCTSDSTVCFSRITC